MAEDKQDRVLMVLVGVALAFIFYHVARGKLKSDCGCK